MNKYAHWVWIDFVWTFYDEIEAENAESALKEVGGIKNSNNFMQCITEASSPNPRQNNPHDNNGRNILAGYNPSSERPKTIWNAFGLFQEFIIK